MKRKEYEHELRRLHGELVAMQEWVKATGAKICIVFEGRDTAGKGGTIKGITERVSPRVFRVVALPAPTEREKSQMYIQRYIPHFPAAGEVVIFDRSWYNRAGVERVMGFCTEEQTRAVPRAGPAVEKAMVDSGIILIKYWLEVSPDEQTRRLESRIDDPRKIWKLSDMDLKSYSRWYDYSRARDAMFARHRHRVGALVRRAHRRQEARPAQHHHPPARARSRTSRSRRADVKLPKRQKRRRLPRARPAAAPHPDPVLNSNAAACPCLGAPETTKAAATPNRRLCLRNREVLANAARADTGTALLAGGKRVRGSMRESSPRVLSLTTCPPSA